MWLWAARFFKTRALAKHAVETGKVEMQGQAIKASKMIKIQDQLCITRGKELFEITVTGIAQKRGSASLAQSLYSESDASCEKREAERERNKMANAGYQAPAKKPDKRARKLILRLVKTDMLPP